MSQTKEKKKLSDGTGLLKQSVMEDYLNREDFSYNPNGDALYRYYRDRYTDQGKLAMADTMGQAAALTGGYGSSYAQSAGQQTYNSYMKELGDVIPQLYQLAYDRYQNQGDDLIKQYELLDRQEQTEYDRHRDQVADDQWQQQLTEDQRQFDQSHALKQQQFTEDQRQFNQNYALNQQQFTEDQRQFNQNYALSQQQLAEDQRQFNQNHTLHQQQFAEDQRQFNQSLLLDQQQLTEDRRQFDQSHALAASRQNGTADEYYVWLNSTQGSGTRKDSTNTYEIAYDNGYVTTGNIIAMQYVLGVEPTGMWSASSRLACGGLSANEAFDLYQKGLLSQVRATT